MTDATKKLSAAALAGLFTAGMMAASPVFAAEEGKAACKNKDKPAAEKKSCTGKDKEAAHCNGKDADGKSHCASKDGEKGAEKPAEAH